MLARRRRDHHRPGRHPLAQDAAAHGAPTTRSATACGPAGCGRAADVCILAVGKMVDAGRGGGRAARGRGHRPPRSGTSGRSSRSTPRCSPTPPATGWCVTVEDGLREGGAGVGHRRRHRRAPPVARRSRCSASRSATSPTASPTRSWPSSVSTPPASPPASEGGRCAARRPVDSPPTDGADWRRLRGLAELPQRSPRRSWCRARWRLPRDEVRAAGLRRRPDLPRVAPSRCDRAGANIARTVTSVTEAARPDSDRIERTDARAAGRSRRPGPFARASPRSRARRSEAGASA